MSSSINFLSAKFALFFNFGTFAVLHRRCIPPYMYNHCFATVLFRALFLIVFSVFSPSNESTYPWGCGPLSVIFQFFTIFCNQKFSEKSLDIFLFLCYGTSCCYFLFHSNSAFLTVVLSFLHILGTEKPCTRRFNRLIQGYLFIYRVQGSLPMWCPPIDFALNTCRLPFGRLLPFQRLSENPIV